MATPFLNILETNLTSANTISEHLERIQHLKMVEKFKDFPPKARKNVGALENGLNGLQYLNKNIRYHRFPVKLFSRFPGRYFSISRFPDRNF